MADVRLAILWNNTEGKSVCPLCSRGFHAMVGYQVFRFLKNTPAIKAWIVCPACIRKKEPELLEMIELHCVYAKYTADMKTLDRAGELGPQPKK
jgi:hypothetical protein